MHCDICGHDHTEPNAPSTATEKQAAAIRWKLVDCHDGVQHWENQPEEG